MSRVEGSTQQQRREEGNRPLLLQGKQKRKSKQERYSRKAGVKKPGRGGRKKRRPIKVGYLGRTRNEMSKKGSQSEKPFSGSKERRKGGSVFQVSKREKLGKGGVGGRDEGCVRGDHHSTSSCRSPLDRKKKGHIT